MTWFNITVAGKPVFIDNSCNILTKCKHQCIFVGHNENTIHLISTTNITAHANNGAGPLSILIQQTTYNQIIQSLPNLFHWRTYKIYLQILISIYACLALHFRVEYQVSRFWCRIYSPHKRSKMYSNVRRIHNIGVCISINVLTITVSDFIKLQAIGW